MTPNAELLDNILRKYVDSEGGSAKSLHTAGFIVKDGNGMLLKRQVDLLWVRLR